MYTEFCLLVYTFASDMIFSVFQVKAYDKDPPENGGKILYQFVSAPNERLKFSINADTGVITTRYVSTVVLSFILSEFGTRTDQHKNVFCICFQTFDRDEPTREKEVYLTVRATDNGKPQLDDVCTIKVVIEDINDNQPVFDKVVSKGFKIRSYGSEYDHVIIKISGSVCIIC